MATEPRECRRCHAMFSGIRCKPCTSQTAKDRYGRTHGYTGHATAKWRACKKCGVSFIGNRCVECRAAYNLAWAHDHPEATKAGRDKFYASHGYPYQRPYDQNRRARKRNASGSFTAAEFNNVVEAQNGRCYDCGLEEKLTVGHAVPLCRGGSNSITNIIGQCLTCNLKQGSKIHPDFLESVAS